MESTARQFADFAAEQQLRFDALVSPEVRKRQGHFGTPPGIAEFMAGLFSKIPTGPIRILDPGAGVGTLSAAICNRIANQKAGRQVFFELWENDPKLHSLLEKTMIHCGERLCDYGHKVEFRICKDDFILANSQRSLFEEGPKPTFHLAITNPPYFKLRKDSDHARAMEHVVHGQPNIYALFMALSADLLLPGGQLVAITPRSYFNGPYFRQFRRWFLKRVAVRQIHVFDSRKDAFKSDAVLQENVILHAEKDGKPTQIVLSTSPGRDLADCQQRVLSYGKVIDDNSGDLIVRVPGDEMESEIVDYMDRLPERIRDLGYEISTGPVVTFRSTEVLCQCRAKNTAPLLWMHNVRPFKTQFPSKNGKPAHILVNKDSQKLLVPAKTYVLLKRFTSKEEKRRLVAGIVTSKDSYSEWLGLENHLNYIYRTQSDISQTEAFGLASFFNSAIVDRYFRAVSGNTQVNASEMRAIPMPDNRTLEKIGAAVMKMELGGTESLERIVGTALKLPSQFIERLVEANL